MIPFYTPWKHLKTIGFLVFSVGIKWNHWPEIYYFKHLLNKYCTKGKGILENTGFNPLPIDVSILRPLNKLKNWGFLMFSGGIEMDIDLKWVK